MMTEICMAVGFFNPGSFSSRFAQLVGETSSETSGPGVGQ